MTLKSLVIIFWATSAIGNAYCQSPSKVSPFTAVKWQDERPLVQYNDEWYPLEKLDSVTTDSILAFCKLSYANKWKKRFSEDIIDVLKGLGHHPQDSIRITLRKGPKEYSIIAAMTSENRAKVRAYNNQNSTEEEPDNTAITPVISREQAIEDLAFLKKAIVDHYSYALLRNVNIDSEIEEIINNIPSKIKGAHLAIEVQKLLSQYGDGHTRVEGLSNILPNGYLPFRVKYYRGKIVCLKDGRDELYNNNFPFLQSVNNVPIDSLLKISSEIVPAGSRQFVTHQSVARLLYIKYLLTEFRALKGDTLHITLQNNNGLEYQFMTPVTGKKPTDRPITDTASLLGKVGYLRITRMASSSGFLANLTSRLEQLKNTDGLIIDIRDNPGGSREVLNLVYPYLASPDAKPLIVNVAVFRTNERPTPPEGYLANRGLFPITSKQYRPHEIEAINNFSKGFEPEWKFPDSLFSDWHYMTLKPAQTKFNYTKPVLVLVNESCFSAADIFAAALKELPNVTLIGQPTGGGSGRAKAYTLPNSNIKLHLSTMVSFQPNGQLFEFNGVTPHIVKEQEMSDIIATSDSQLDLALKLLNNNIK